MFSRRPEVERDRSTRVRAVRASRSASECQAALAAVERAARGGDNLVPAIIEAVEKRATLGEICRCAADASSASIRMSPARDRR